MVTRMGFCGRRYPVADAPDSSLASKCTLQWSLCRLGKGVSLD